jgi:hypothetical protein
MYVNVKMDGKVVIVAYRFVMGKVQPTILYVQEEELVLEKINANVIQNI